MNNIQFGFILLLNFLSIFFHSSLCRPENKTFLTDSDLEVSSRDIVDINGTVVVVTAEVDVTTNEVCTASSSGSRRKREISFVSQQLLLSILSDKSLWVNVLFKNSFQISHNSHKFIVAIPVRTPDRKVFLNQAKELLGWGTGAIMIGCSS